MISRMFNKKKPAAPPRQRRRREMGKGGYVFIGLLIAAFVVLVIVFAFQTYGLVSGLFPSDNIFMQGVTVFSFDGCCIIYAGLELFYVFKSKGAFNLTGIMWFVTFGGSLLCTIAYMNLSSDHLLHTIVNTNVLIAAYGLVTIVFAGDIVAITYIIRMEWNAYLDEKYGEQDEETRTAVLSQMPQPTSTYVPPMPQLELDETGQWRIAGQTRPLVQAPTSNQDESNPMFEAFKRGIEGKNGAH